MFKENKYTKWYFNIINNAINRTHNSIFETHHIIPRSIGGNDKISNLVALNPREHFICHMLLTKMVKSTKNKERMVFAFWCMVNGFGTAERYIPKSRTIAIARTAFILQQRERYSGAGNPFYGKKHSKETRAKMSVNNAMHRPEIREKCKGPRPNFMPHNYYTGWSDETKAKISKSLKGHSHTESTKQKMRHSKIDVIWVNKPFNKPKQIKKELFKQFVSDGWVRGRGPRAFW